MILYLDTSALVKLYVEEEGTEAVQRAVDNAESIATSVVAYPEARSAFARLERDVHLSSEEHRTAVAALDRDWPAYEVVDVTRSVGGVGGALAAQYLLRGFDAVHLASAIVVGTARELSYHEASESGDTEALPPEVLLMTYDNSLFAAARTEGMAYESRPAGEDETK
ncbi:MAG: type II toxin-antitoxin system VapC family toxin [Acidobacteria bacterium]|nr:type II toxin-antitoxin system VapC family toxin [Acidobacteriota bacterium]